MVYSDYKVYGPYNRNDGRLHVCLVAKNGQSRKTVSYPKFLLEVHLGRLLTADETVDHIDGDFRNNAITNLQILPRAKHASLDAKRRVVPEVACPVCGDTFLPSRNQTRRRNRDTAGPFCSKRCTGAYGASVQNGGAVVGRTPVTVAYKSVKEHQQGKPSE